MQQKLPEIEALGIGLVAISPELPDRILTTAEKNALGFEVLSDQGNEVARSFGLVFTLPEELRPIYKQFGIDLPSENGDDTYALPIPATYVINTEGIITNAFVDADYTSRVEPEELLTVLRENFS